MSVTLDIQNLSVTYSSPRGEIPAVRECSFSVSRGDVAGLVGESGSGKTSVLMAIPRLLPRGTAVTGRILCDGENLLSLGEEALNTWRWRRFALVPQGTGASFTPQISIGGHIMEVLRFHFHMKKEEARNRAMDLLKTTGLETSFFARYPHELSGGQKQRAALATALACDPDFLLADEPTTALDVVTQKEVLSMIVSLVRSRGMGLLLVTHDLPLAAGICDRLVVMKEGRIVENGPCRQVVEHPRSPSTRELIEALRRMERPGALVAEAES
ncbi:MAG: ABC transporter ATP-binding protein [Synergistaceae bacterium]|jgi:ABC-type glutathione transport system ATPase component|nr:ABC transporter ATP-binding protein [Synergistaceae bacterium]